MSWLYIYEIIYIILNYTDKKLTRFIQEKPILQEKEKHINPVDKKLRERL